MNGLDCLLFLFVSWAVCQDVGCLCVFGLLMCLFLVLFFYLSHINASRVFCVFFLLLSFSVCLFLLNKNVPLIA